ncbi:MAG: hypothetical protein AAB538_05165, partial [Patescibacteria group bacterium]
MKTVVAALAFVILWDASLEAIAQEDTSPASSSPEVTSETINQAAEKLTENQKRIQEKEDEISQLNKKIEELRGQRDSAAAQADLINVQLTRLAQTLAKAELELKQTQLNIEAVQDESERTTRSIEEIERNIVSKRQQLRSLFRKLYEEEQKSFLSLLLSSQSISEVLAERSAYEKIQAQTAALVSELQGELATLEKEKQALEVQQADLTEL